MVKITSVARHSRAAKQKIRENDFLVSINGNEINDVLDYRFYLADESIDVVLMRDGETHTVHIDKNTYDDIGLDFETPLMDKKHSCKNGCIFCFIDQLPKGMRETLYFKDDDSRLSFIHGNYVTLTNLHDEDIDRIIKMRISPINISVHTTNPELRVKMMKNKRAGEVLKYLDRFCEADINMRGQIVLCRGINDGEELMRTMRDLSRFYPAMDSVSIVPAGLTRFREGLYPLTQYTRDEAREVIEQIDTIGRELYEKNGSRMFFAADEFYIKAGLDIPDADYYEGYPQIENGVGMVRSLMDDFNLAIENFSDFTIKRKREISMATGVAAYPYISEIAEKLQMAFPNLTVHVYKIINEYFGEEITVSGLLTGKDLCTQLDGKRLGKTLIIPSNALREGEDVFLCGMKLCELERNLGVKTTVAGEDADSLISAVLGRKARRKKNG
ncbi:MAG: DUF512 domain-containing protein [Eubacteriales bacterium]|nr:DUF512 domain-containing protein [Eubacteriales bacterium]